MAREILEGKGVIAKRVDDRDELMAIRNGELPFDALVEWAEAQDAELQPIYEKSPLPYSANRVKLDALCRELVEEAL
jgi:hypothetical protein